jgi:putative Mg2+ transporter-C (MgtC) family protein
MTSYIIGTGEIAIRLATATILGGLVGWERERKDGAAGLRTHMLVCTGSSLVMIVSAFGFEDILGHANITLDPSRIAAQVVSGIGFLGAGTILFLRPQIVRGLTTAAGLWAVAAIGLAVGGGLYSAALMTTMIVLIVLAVIKPLERTMFKHAKRYVATLLFDPEQISLAQIENTIKKHALTATEISIHSSKDDALDQVKLTFSNKTIRTDILSALDEFKTMEGIREITSKV